MKAKIKRESCKKNKMRVLQELDQQKTNKAMMAKSKNEQEKNQLMNKINQDIDMHSERRKEQMQKVQMKAMQDLQKVEIVKKNSPNKENRNVQMELSEEEKEMMMKMNANVNMMKEDNYYGNNDVDMEMSNE